MTSHRSRPPMKARKIEPKSESSIIGDGSVLSESEFEVDRVSKWYKRNGVANSGEPKKLRNKYSDLERVKKILSDNEDLALAYN